MCVIPYVCHAMLFSLMLWYCQNEGKFNLKKKNAKHNQWLRFMVEIDWNL